MTRLAAELDEAVLVAAGRHFQGAVRVDVRGETLHRSAHGLADRAHGIANTPATRFAAASATKSCTAIAVMQLVESGGLRLDSTAREVLGDALPLLDPAVTVGHLLSHRAGVPEYCGEPGKAGPDLPGPVVQCALDQPADVLELAAGLPMASAVDAEFRYCNTGYVLLALVIERVTGQGYADVIERSVLEVAGMAHSAMLATDELPGDAAVGYVAADGLRSNAHLVPRRGLGDGGLYTTVDDVACWWNALMSGRLVGHDAVAAMVTRRGATPGGTPYGFGFWLSAHTDAVQMEGYDQGISFRSVHRPSRDVTWTVMSNWTDGAWGLANELDRILGTSRS